MPRITKIVEQKRSPSRRSVYLDGRFGLGCHLNVVARFRLREGMELTAEQVEEIRRGEVRQACMDKALSYLGTRLHSRSELEKKLSRAEHDPTTIHEVLAELERLGYVDDARFAKTRALAAAEHKQHGRRRAYMELLKSGVQKPVAERALEDVYEQTDSLGLARQFAQKQAPRLRRLEPVVARRRLTGALLRRGFDYDVIRPVLDEVLGGMPEEHPEG